jgi:SAM-dependent methyltransferase
MASFMLTVRSEIAAGGIARDDGEIQFYTRVNALLRPDMTVVDFGCGRGAVFDSGEFAYRERLAKLQGKVKKVIGVDVDDAICQHPFLDERHVLESNAPIPAADATVDMVIAHWVFEHIDDPSRMADEFLRVLKPGGWVCARTPHRWSYLGVAAQIIPERFHNPLLGRVKPGIKASDKFPTAYRLNSHRALKKYFPDDKWINYTYGMSSTPRYHFENRILFHLFAGFHAVSVPKIDLMVLFQKR